MIQPTLSDGTDRTYALVCSKFPRARSKLAQEHIRELVRSKQVLALARSKQALVLVRSKQVLVLVRSKQVLVLVRSKQEQLAHTRERSCSSLHKDVRTGLGEELVHKRARIRERTLARSRDDGGRMPKPE